MIHMKMITLFMNIKDLKRLDALVSQDEGPNRSELIRYILKAYLEKHAEGLVVIPPAEVIKKTAVIEDDDDDEDEDDE